MEEQVNRNYWVYKSSKYKYDFRNIPAMRSCSNRIFFGKITISEADKKESNLTKAILQFNDEVRLRSKAGNKEKKQMLIKIWMLVMKTKNEWMLLDEWMNEWMSGTFSLQLTQGKGLKTLAPKQKPERLQIALACNTSDNSLTEIHQNYILFVSSKRNY